MYKRQTNDYTNEEKQKLSGLNNYTLPTASASQLGGVKVGNNLGISDGVLSAEYDEATTSEAGLMSAADKATLDGVASGANTYTLPTASASQLGGVNVGSGLALSLIHL